MGARRHGAERGKSQNKLILECEARRYRQIIAIIGDSGHVASIEFHKSPMFAYAGEIVSVGYKYGKWLDTVIMQRALGPGDKTPPEGMPED